GPAPVRKARVSVDPAQSQRNPPRGIAAGPRNPAEDPHPAAVHVQHGRNRGDGDGAKEHEGDQEQRRILRHDAQGWLKPPWPLAPGPWPLAPGPWPLAPGPWPLAPGPWALAPGPWPL